MLTGKTQGKINFFDPNHSTSTLNVHTERYGGTAPTLLIVSSYVSCLTGAVVFAWDRSLLIVCSQDICCVRSQGICILSAYKTSASASSHISMPRTTTSARRSRAHVVSFIIE